MNDHLAADWSTDRPAIRHIAEMANAMSRYVRRLGHQCPRLDPKCRELAFHLAEAYRLAGHMPQEARCLTAAEQASGEVWVECGDELELEDAR